MESYGGSLKYFKVYLRSREQYIQINRTEKKNRILVSTTVAFIVC